MNSVGTDGSCDVRARSLGIPFDGEAGPNNAITDVPGVEVGYATIQSEKPLARTGVTVILPRGRELPLMPVWAGLHSFNGNGELTGSHWINEGGNFSGPICLTNTHAVGAVHDGVTQWMAAHYGSDEAGAPWFLPVVGETWDGYLNDINAFTVRGDHVFEAIAAAHNGAIAEGNVGGGTGMRAFGFKGGSGTSSRVFRAGDQTWTLGAFVQANFGRPQDLVVRGRHVGSSYPEQPCEASLAGFGSLIGIIATDVPLLPGQLSRIARRAVVGMARTGTPGQHESGDIFLAFSTSGAVRQTQEVPVYTVEYLADHHLTNLFACAADAVEEAILNALVAAKDTAGRDGRRLNAIDHSFLRSIFSSSCHDLG